MYDIDKTSDLLADRIAVDDIEDITGKISANSFHPMITADNIVSIMPQNCNTETLQAMWLQKKKKATASKVIRDFFLEKMGDKMAKSIIDRRPIFDGTARIYDTEATTNSHVGFEITPVRVEGVILAIEEIGLQIMDRDNTGLELDIPISLYHSDIPEPLQTITVHASVKGGMNWIKLTEPILLPYQDENKCGGSYYLVYEEKALGTARAVSKNRDFSKKPCMSCGSYDYATYQMLSPYVEFYPMRIKPGEPNEAGIVPMWDIADNIYTPLTNYGLNVKFSIYCDHTRFIEENIEAFVNVLGLQFACDMLREFAYNPNFRINRMNQNFQRNELLYEIDGDTQSPRRSGLKWELEKAYQAIKTDFSGLNKICMPCRNNGIRMQTV